MSPDVISQLKSVIDVTVDAAETTRGRHVLKPDYGARAGSEAAVEFAEQASFAVRDDNMPVLDAYTTAFLGLTASGDELRCVRTLLVGSDSFPVYGPAALLRTVMEVSARAWWTLEPGIGTRRRVLRGYIDRVTSLIETSRIRVGEPSDGDELVRTTSLKRLDRLVEDVRSLDVEIRRGKRGALLRVGEEEVPSHTGLIRDQLGYPGDAAYRVLSGVAHGTLYALTWRTTAVEGTRLGSAEMRQPTPDFSVLLRDVAITLLGYRAAVDRLLQLFGWDRTEWEATKVEASRVVARLFREMPNS